MELEERARRENSIASIWRGKVQVPYLCRRGLEGHYCGYLVAASSTEEATRDFIVLADHLSPTNPVVEPVETIEPCRSGSM